MPVMTENAALNISYFREKFPALHRMVNGRPALYLDGPGGTQVPHSVIDAMGGYLANGLSNSGGPFHSSRVTDETTRAARQAMVDFYNAHRPEEIIFGQNMTSLTFSMSRALAREWQAGDEIIVTRIDHDANISPWLLAAEDRGVTVRWLDFRREDCTLALDTLPNLLNERTKLVAVNYASNAVGTINDVRHVVSMAHEVGALAYVDAVHYAPHDLIDVKLLDCDFLASSAYKYFGPHTGILYGKYEHLDRLQAYKVRPASDKPAGKWETGTQSFESLAGVTAAVDYIAYLTDTAGSRRERLVAAMTAVKEYEMDISAYFLQEATKVPGLRVYGITDVETLEQRTPTFAVSLEGHSAESVATALGEQGIYVWHGHYYALAVMERLGLLESGGLVRIGFVHYNTKDEVDQVLESIANLTG
jgi:cysteine desulfurase family protein (TIGR01976 family)